MTMRLVLQWIRQVLAQGRMANRYAASSDSGADVDVMVVESLPKPPVLMPSIGIAL